MTKGKYEKTAQRIKELVEIKCGGSQQRFAEVCGIGKYSVSQYVNAKNSPGNITAVKISRAFGVDPLWVMGEDVPMYKDNISQSVEMTDHEEDIFRKYRMLSPFLRDAVDNMIISLHDSVTNAETIMLKQKVNDDES